MSHILKELQQISSNICVLSDSYNNSLKLFRALLESQIEHASRAEISSASSKESLLKNTLSVSLGRRTIYKHRLHFNGFLLSDIAHLRGFIESADAFILNLSSERPNMTDAFQIPLPQSALNKPWILCGLGMLAQLSAEGQAYLRAAQRQVQYFHYLERSEDFFKDCLEWVLSF